MIKEKVDVLVIGAGPAGTVAASIVHQAGYSVKIVEKQTFPRFVIGESLLPRCMEALDEAKFLDAVRAAGFQEKGGAKFEKNGKICDYSFAEAFTPGWTWTWQVPRAEFDKILADTVASMGVPVAYETTVTGIEFLPDHSSVTTVVDASGESSVISARFIIDGSGYGRVIPRLFGLDKPSSLPPRKAMFCHLKDPRRAAADEPNRITIVVHEHGVWIWIIPFSNGNTSVGFVGDPAFFDRMAAGATGGAAGQGAQGADAAGALAENGAAPSPDALMRALIASQPYIASRLEGVDFIWEPRTLQSWSSTTDRFFGDGFVLTGNVTEFLDPVFSSGVTLATVSSQMAAHLVIRTLRGETVDWTKEYTEPMMQGVNTFRTYVNTWYEGVLDTIFFADDQDPLVKSQICSVLAGYVWDLENPYVKNHATALYKLEAIIQFRDTHRKKTAVE
ncbi:NAD(P)/FAD-dependent oxidoreductase [Dinghuibacter silviterrae]|uniref:Flavin-dependent dehydrogenase n=1 Tax=Dinghuibacter silviterrae TaxID=1539049 RepID=A0A4R8DV42_9BACT|nr:tryptophan 7-halogenase [Dinghuibacter silviterrae]TDX02282.1 flavin-dependent dehydrogenase [Dinghuibacter silviterrae]